jgi:branched-chain amino acid transport system substrate-binding protein
MSIKRRSVLKGMLATGASIATLKAPAVHAQAAPFKLGLLTVKTGPLAQGGIQMEQGVLTFLKETEQHDGRPQGRLLLRRHRRQPGGHQDQGAGAGRARQGRRHPRAARRFELLAITDYIAQVKTRS